MTRIFGMQRESRLLKLSIEGIWIALGQVMAISGSLVGIRIMTGMMSPDVYGELALGMTVSTLANQTFFGPISNGAARFYSHAVETGGLRTYLHAVRKLTIASTAMFAIICVGASLFFWAQGNRIITALVIGSCVFGSFGGISNILSGIQNAARHRAYAAIRQGIEPWARFLAAAGLMSMIGKTSSMAMAGYALGSIFVFTTQLSFFQKIKRQETTESCPPSPEKWQNQLLEYSWPFATWGILLWIYLSSGRWALQFFRSTTDVGYYAVLLQLGYYPFTLLASMMLQFLAPIYFQKAGNSSDPRRVHAVLSLAWLTAKVSIAGTLVFALFFAVFHVDIFNFLVSPEYKTASSLMPQIVIAAGLLTSSQFLSMGLQAQKSTRILLLPKNVSYVVGTLLTLIGAAYMGLPGVVYAAVFTTLIHFIWLALIFSNQRSRCKAELTKLDREEIPNGTFGEV